MSTMPVLCLHGPLRKPLGNRPEHELPGDTVIELLRSLEREHPEISGWILDERGRIRRHINVFVNGDRGTEGTTVGSGDRVEVLPAITGGFR
jgi:molybdopterin converting factor small subunit